MKSQKPQPKPAAPTPAALPAPVPAAPAAPSVPLGGLLVPCAEDDVLVAQFKRYVSLRDKLCEDTDYIWSVAYVGPTGDEDRKFFSRREKAEAFLAAVRERKLEGELEKKLKKSGVLKLAKAFSISQEVIEEVLDRAAGTAHYKVRASAPNGQFAVRSGSCDRNERGKKNAPFDTIMATALTRAADRAIMALLGGETTAEEFEGGDEPEDVKPAPVQEPVEPVGPPMSHDEALASIDARFAHSPAANPDTPRMRYTRALYKAAGALYGNDADKRIHATIKARYGVDSVTKLTDEQFREIAEGVTALARKMGKLK